MRKAATLGLVALAMSASCSHAGGGGDLSTCAPLLSYRGPKGPLSFGACAGHLDPDTPPGQVTMAVGAHFTVSGVDGLVSSDAAVVRVTAAEVVDDHHIVSTRFGATSPGQATVSVRSTFCGGSSVEPVSGTPSPAQVCPFLVVTVTAR